MSWDQRFHRVAPGRAATTFPSDNTNAGGFHGPLDVNLGAIGSKADVRVRFRHFEQTDDEFVAIDNVVVDDVAPPESGSTQIFLEDFDDLTLGKMGVYVYAHLGGFFGTDSGAGGVSGFSWGTEDRASPGRPGGRYQAGAVGTKNVNHLGHPTAEVNDHVPFAIIDSAAEEDGMAPEPDSFQSERLHTPILDLTGLDTVILEWDEEVIYDGNPAVGSVASVVLMRDDGDGVPNAADTIINEPNKNNNLFAPYSPYDQLGGGLFSGGDDPVFGHRYLDISADAAGSDDIYVAFQYGSSDTDFWAVDNVRVTSAPLLPCNFNTNSTCDLLDINLMFMQGNLTDSSTTVGPTENKFDLIDNNIIDSADVDEWLSGAATANTFVTPYRRGDADLDRDVDITDFNALAANFRPTATATSYLNGDWHLGNFDGDGDIDITDFNSLAGNFASSGYGGNDDRQIPEPGTMTLFVLGLLACTGLYQRR